MPSVGRAAEPYAPDEARTVQARLNTRLAAADISYRPAAQGTVAYLEGWKAFNLANEVFGFNGWSSEILSLTTDFEDTDAQGRVSLGMSCMVRIHLKDGTFHDDIGYGSCENQKSRAASYEKARKEAVTDAMKRALRIFGNRLGNCAYDKAFLRDIKKAPAPCPAPVPVPVPAALPPPFPVVPVAPPQGHHVPQPPFDEFENSMMISEEDFFIATPSCPAEADFLSAFDRAAPYPLPPRSARL